MDHAREVEALEKRPHGALLFARAVAQGSGRVLGSAAGLLAVHSAELAAAEAAAAARRAGPSDHWKRWKPDGLDALGKTLGKGVRASQDLVHTSFYRMGFRVSYLSLYNVVYVDFYYAVLSPIQ